MSTISVKEKQDFIKWFLSRYIPKQRESVWILNYLASHESITRNVKFVQEATLYENGQVLVISSKCVKEPSLIYIRNGAKTMEGDKAFNAVRLNRAEPLFIELRFSKRNQSHEYAGICEVNREEEKQVHLNSDEITMINDFLHFSLRAIEIEQLKEKVDSLLDLHPDWTEQQQEEMIQLTIRIRELEKK